MDTDKFIPQLLEKIYSKKLNGKQKLMLHDKVLKLDLEDILCVFPEVFGAGILDKRDGQALFDELLERHDRTQLYPLVFDCVLEKANFLTTKQLEELEEEVVAWAPIDIALCMVDTLKNTKFLKREKIERIAFRVLRQEHISCYARAYDVFEDLDVFETEDLEVMWQKTMAIGDIKDCVDFACALSEEEIVSKEDVLTLLEETLEIPEENKEFLGDGECKEKTFRLHLNLLGAFFDKNKFSKKQIKETKEFLLANFKGKDCQIELMNIFADILNENPFDDAELESAKKSFMKTLKDAVKTADGIAEIISSSKKASPQNPDYDKMILPAFCDCESEKFVIDWANVFTKQDKKTIKEIAIKTKRICVYEYYLLIFNENIEELDNYFEECGECFCDCCECEKCN